MADLIDRAAAIDALESKAYRHTYLDQIVGIIEDLPSAQPKGYTDQLRWERDTAIQQLKELGYGLGEKPRTDGDTISRQAAIDVIRKWKIYETTEGLVDCINKLPPAQPELLKCKDCYWWTTQEDSMQGRCARYKFYPTGYWYCAAARERRTDD